MQQQYRGHLCLMNRIGNPDVAPTGRLMVELAEHLRRYGWQATIISVPSAVRAARSVGSLSRSFLIMVTQALRMKKPVAAIISMTDPPGLGLLGRILAWVWRCPSIHWCQDLYPDVLLPRWGRLIRRFHPGHTHVIVPGPDMAPACATHIFNWPEQNIIPQPLPDLGDGVLLLYSGNLGWVSDLTYLLKAWDDIGDGLELRICGEGRQSHKWHALQTEPQIKFMPPVPVDQLPAHLGRHHIHIIVMRRGTGRALMPMKFITAMAAGRPVLLLAEPDITLGAWVRDHHLGWVVPPDDVAAIRAVLTEIKTHPDRVATCAAAARAWYAAHQSTIGPDYLAQLITKWLSNGG